MMTRCRRTLCAASVTLLAALTALAAAPEDEDPYRLDELRDLPLSVEVLQERTEEGVRIMHLKYTSEVYRDQPVRIFAIYACPAVYAEKIPGVLWTQSGLYQASEYFPVLLAKRGYGCLCIDAPFGGYRSSAVAGYDVWHIADPITDHSAVRIARALHRGVSFLASRPEIDTTRIGAAGSSWGGYSSFLVAGLDERIKVVSTFFGCGNLHLGCAWQGELARHKGEALERWRRLYDPAARIPARKGLATMITTGTNDHFYQVPAVNKTYSDGPGDKRLAWIPHYNHILDERGDEMVFEYLDHHLRPGEGTPFNEVVNATLAKRDGRLVATFASHGQREVAEAAVWFSYGPDGHWQGRLWSKAPAKDAHGVYEAEIPVLRPEEPLMWFALVTDATGAYIGTPIAMADPKGLGITEPSADRFEGEGCLYGDFETEGMTYLQRSGASVAPVDALNPHTGEQCLKLVAGDKELTFSTDYLRWCPAFPAEFSAWVRGSGARVAFTVFGAADSQKIAYTAEATAGEQWERAVIRVPAFKAGTSGILRFDVRVPAGQTVYLDTVSFQPVPLAR